MKNEKKNSNTTPNVDNTKIDATGITFPQEELFIKIFKEKIYLVGGTIRDYLLYGDIGQGRDIDLVVTDHTYEEIEQKLQTHGKTNTVGKSFAVVKFTIDNQTYDISVPRKEIKKDPESHGHKNFIIEFGPHIKLEEDLKRRDFTCNSIAMRLIDKSIVDLFDGVGAIREKVIKMTGPETFVDDPLRILRAARFASVHQFAIDESIYMCSRDVELNELSKERITEELFRILLESERPSIGLNEYFKLTVLEKLFPPLYPLTLTIQDAVFHPETDEYGHHTVWGHTMIAVDIAKKVAKQFDLDDEQTLALLLGVLFHDVAKAQTTRWDFKRGRMTITSMFHDSQGVEIAEKFLTEYRIETKKHFPLKKTVLNLIKAHHRIFELYRNREDIGFRAISRLVKDMENQDQLLLLLDFADRQSREPNPLDFKNVDEITLWYMQKKKEFNINKDTIKPIIQGRDLKKLGVKPGVQMGVYLKKLYERQLDGQFDTIAKGLKLFKEVIRDAE